MFASTDMMRMAQALTSHAGARQKALARNVANADTPGYRAVDLPAFDPGASSGMVLRATRPGHVAAPASGMSTRLVALRAEAAPNGNTVSLEGELVRGADVKRQHELAVTIMQSGLRLARTAIGRGR